MLNSWYVSVLCLVVMFVSCDWQKHVKGQIEHILCAMFRPDAHPVSIRFVRHAPGRRRNDVCMYQVCTASSAQAEAVRGRFSLYLRRESPLPRPQELTGISIYPMVSSLCLFSRLFYRRLWWHRYYGMSLPKKDLLCALEVDLCCTFINYVSLSCSRRILPVSGLPFSQLSVKVTAGRTRVPNIV